MGLSLEEALSRVLCGHFSHEHPPLTSAAPLLASRILYSQQVRHAGSTVRSGLRYVLGGFIALNNRVEHVRQNETKKDTPSRATV